MITQQDFFYELYQRDLESLSHPIPIFLSPRMLTEQNMMSGLIQVMLDTDLFLYRERLRRAEARWQDWLKFDEHEETLCRGEMR